MTPTLKLKRPLIYRLHKELFEGMYQHQDSVRVAGAPDDGELQRSRLSARGHETQGRIWSAGEPHDAHFDADAARQVELGSPDLADLDRPLAPRGQETAPLIARYIKQSRWQPDLVLCSPATRVRETWQLMTPVLGRTVGCKTLRTIYPGRPAGSWRRCAGSPTRSRRSC